MRGKVLAVLVCSAVALAAAPHALAATFTVTTTSFASTGGCDAASCNLTEAIQATYGSPGSDVIEIPAGLYSPPAPLPTLADVSVVGLGNPGPRIDGEGLGEANGLLFFSEVPGASSVTNVTITRFGARGIDVRNAQAVTITGSFIGTDPTFATGLGNGTGVYLGSANSVVGGGSPSERNVISGNSRWGVELQLSSAANNRILGNVIGLRGDGPVALPNGSGGIRALDAPNTRIGSGAPGEGNSIGGNSGDGIVIEGASSAGTVVEGNLIGAGVGNTANGIQVRNGAANITIGAPGSAANTIRSNSGAGVDLIGADVTNVAISGNQIFQNGGLGIDLGSDGPTSNDPEDTDNGPNDLLNFPDLTSAVATGGTVDIDGFVGTDAGTGTYRIEFFRNDDCNGEAPNDFGEGQVYLGFQDVVAPNTLGVSFSSPAFSVPSGAVVTATVTFEGKTSELSQCRVVTDGGGGGPSFEVTTTADSGPGSLRQAILDANGQPGEQMITFDISVPELGPKVIALASALPPITDPVTIDGTTQPGYVASPNTPFVVIDGASLVEQNGLEFAEGSDGSQVRALSITNVGTGPPYAAVRVQAPDVEIYRMFLGVRPNGTTLGRNGVGIYTTGIDTVVGSTNATDANLIVGSYGPGIETENSGALIRRNEITGLADVAGSGNGIGVLNDGATSTRIEGNTIRDSEADGVQILSPSADVDVVSNLISENGGLGINIGTDGVTPNSADLGPVYHENFPVNLNATPVGGGLEVTGEFSTRGGASGAGANESYLIELFRNDACDPSGNGEGQNVLAQLPVTTNADGFAAFSTVVPAATTGAITATATALAASSSRATSEFSACFVVGGGGPGGVTLDAVQASVPSTGIVPLASIPGSALVARPAGTTQASPIRDIPIRDIPIRDIPIRDIPIRDIPIRDIGFTDPFVLPLLASFSLADIPLLRPGGWPAALEGTSLAAAPLQNVSLRDVLALSPEPSGIAGLSLVDLDLSRTPLGRVPAAAVVLGAVPLRSLPLPGGADWCALAGPGVECSASSNVLAISIQGAPIADIPIADIPIRDIPIADIPIADIPIRDIPIADIPIRDIPIADIPIADIPIADIGGLIDCNAHPCATSKLYDAFVGGWFLPGATLGRLLLALPEPNDVTLADVLVLLFSSTATVGWEQIDLETAGLQAAAAAGNGIDWNADVQLTGPGTAATVVLPKGSVFDPSVTPTVRTLPAGAPTPLPAPEVGRTAAGEVTLEWQLVGAVGSTLRIAFQAYPPFRVGPQAGTLEATTGGPTATSDPAPYSVSETFEPNGESSPEPVSPGALYVSYITQADDLDFYRLPAPPVGSTIRVYLSHLPADYDLALYAPADAELRPEVSGREPLDSPPLLDDGVPLTTRQDALPPETLDDLRLDATRPLVGVSANRGTEDDSVVAVSGGGTGDYLIQVTPYNGATSADAYVLRVEVEPPRLDLSAAPLPAAAGTTGTVPSSLPAGTNTLFLWNRSQLTAQYGAGPAASVLGAMQATQGPLATLGFPSAIVGVDGNPAVASAVAAWNADPGDPNKANAVVRAVNAVVDGLRAQPNGTGIRYLVIVGGDRAMPFARLEDYVTIANESGFASAVGADNELAAALGGGRILSDDAYADTSPRRFLNRQLFVPTLSVGRLVESPDEIVDALARFRSFDGRLDPSTGRVAGYDFLADGAQAVRAALDARPGVTMQSPEPLIGQTWTQADLADALLGGTPPSLASLNAHADYSRFQPPSTAGALTRPVPFTTTDLTASAAAMLPNRLVFSMGCHAGLSVGDAIVTQQVLDWPQAFAREGATYLGNTTFGYGDSATIAYSEELNRLLAEHIRTGGPIGDALRLAKNEYFSTRGVFGVYDEKAMAAFTLYGMPMWSIGAVPAPASVVTGGVQPLAASAGPSTLAIPATSIGTDPVTGLAIEKFDASPAFDPVTVGTGTYLRGDSGIQVSHLRPIQPKLVIDLGGVQGHGALVTGLTSSDAGGTNPVYARPVVDQSATEPELSFNDVAYPSKLLTVRTYETTAGTRQRLVVGTGQFFGNPAAVDANGTGVQRRYTRIEGQVYRSTSTDRTAPAFTSIDAFTVSGNAAFTVDVSGSDAKRVLAGYRSGSASVWQFVDLAEGPGNRWSGGGPVASSTFEYFVQVVDAAGNVGVSTNKGFYFDGAPLPPDPTPNGPVELDPPAPTGDNGWYRGSVTVTVDGPEGVPVQVSIDGGPFAAPGTDGQVTVSGDGVHTVVARAATGATGATDTVLIPIDGSAPDVVFETPANGASYEPGASLPAAYACVDRGSGATSCSGTVTVGTPISTTPGPKTFSVTTRDRAGNEATRSVTYNVVFRKILFASTRTGLGDIYAIARDGSGLTRLTTSAAPDTEPAWSPDGTKIAFAGRRGGLDLDIFVMNADGSDPVQLTSARGDDTAPAWSPDGTRIAFQSARNGNSEIYVMNADGTSQTRLTSHSRLDTGPTWSPDGSKLAWSRGTLANMDIYTMNANGTGAVRIVKDGRDPNWGPSGKIAFTRSLVGPFVWEVFTMNANGTGITRLTTARGPDYDPVWSSDGEQIAFASGRGGGANIELYVMQQDGSGQQRVTTSPGVDRTPDW